MRSVARSLVLALLVAGAIGGCSSLPWLPTPAPTPVPLGVKVVTPPEQMRLEMNNSTTTPVVLSVNGGVVREFGPGTVANLGQTEIGPPPWAAQVRTGSGRLGPAVIATSDRDDAL